MTHRRLVVTGALVLGVLAPSADAQPISESTVADWISRGVSAPRIRSETDHRCLAYIVDNDLARAYAQEGADSAVISILRGACYMGSALEIAADRPGATVKLQDRPVGSIPWSSPVKANRVSVTVEQGAWTQRATVDVRENQYVLVKFHPPADTIPVPQGPSPLELAQLAADTAGYTPRTPPPPEPIRPSARRTLGGTLIGALVGGAVGAGLGFAVCHTSSPTYAYNSTLGYNTQSGTSSSLSGACAAATTGGGVVAGGFVGNLIARSGYAAEMRRYEQASRAHPADLARWQAQNRADSADFVSKRRAAYTAALASAEHVQAAIRANAATRAHNATLGEADISVGPAHRIDHVTASPASQP